MANKHNCNVLPCKFFKCIFNLFNSYFLERQENFYEKKVRSQQNYFNIVSYKKKKKMLYNNETVNELIIVTQQLLPSLMVIVFQLFCSLCIFIFFKCVFLARYSTDHLLSSPPSKKKKRPDYTFNNESWDYFHFGVLMFDLPNRFCCGDR